MAIVTDPFGAASDPALPQLTRALDPEQAEASLKRGLPRLSGEGVLGLREITVLRHKPGKRCVVEYRVRIKQPGQEPSSIRIIGKTRARRFGQASFRLQRAFWEKGFSDASPDRICVPEALGHIPELEMWFQRRIKGEVSTCRFASGTEAGLPARIAEAAYKVHRSGVSTAKRHTVHDELRILETCLRQVETSHPHLQVRLEKLWAGCGALGKTLEGRPLTGIHRDFYSDQVILRKGRLYLIDFDLYCQGDPAVDIGNFTAHLTELSLRLLGCSNSLRGHETDLVERYLELAGPEHAAAIHAYHVLTLARHVYLSTLFAERRSFTEPLLALCEEQLYSTRTR